MKRFLAIAVSVPALVFTANAQDENVQFRKLKVEADQMAAQAKVVSFRSAVMGKTVKDAPYSGTEINETNQVLADGTRIHNESQAQVYRDSEGRTRRETGDTVSIFDPVAKVSYILNSKDQTARQMPLGGGVFYMSQDGQPGTFTVKLPPLDPAAAAKAKAERGTTEAKEARIVSRTMVTAGAVGGSVGAITTDRMEWFGKEAAAGTPESLGTQNIGGVTAEGTRTTSTIPTGAIGNDRPLQTVNERWFSPELQMIVQSRSTDPRMGEETFRLTSVSRAEPPAYLFQVPAGYQTISPK